MYYTRSTWPNSWLRRIYKKVSITAPNKTSNNSLDVMIICIQHNLVIYSVCNSTNGYIFLPSISAYLLFKRNKVNWWWWFKSFIYCSAFNWTVPWLSVLAVVALSVITFILYMIPLRYIILLWGKCSGIELCVNCFK